MKICKLHNFKRQCTARLDDESTGFLSTNGKVYILNNISYEILLMLEGGNSQEEIINQLCQKYSVSCRGIHESIKETGLTLNLKGGDNMYKKPIMMEVDGWGKHG